MGNADIPTVYEFKMDAWTPDTLPMKRFVDYLSKLVVLFGAHERVHFEKVTRGSAVIRARVEPVAAKEVRDRLRTSGRADDGGIADEGDGEEFERARAAINSMLRDDGSVGILREHGKGGCKIIEFPGRKTPIVDEVVIYETGTLDGVVIRVGGKPPTVPVHLEADDGRVYACYSNKDIAKQLAPNLYGNQVRVSGKGKWLRNREGEWQLESFKIDSFDLLDSTLLTEVIEKLRKVEGSLWNSTDDPHAELNRLRDR
jgi:hypothetical protein